MSAGIGISMYPNDGIEIDVLIRKADDAMCRERPANVMATPSTLERSMPV